MKLALFAFEAFGAWTGNSTQEVTAAVGDLLRAEGVEVVREVLPVVFSEAPGRVLAMLDEERPDAVLATGLAGNRPDIDVERVAINVADFRIPDNEGVHLAGQPIVADGPDAWLANVDVRGMRECIAETGARARVSNSAGTYLCNAVAYSVLGWCRPRQVPGIFLHIPPLPDVATETALRCPGEADPAAAMPFELQVTGVAAAARFMLDGSAVANS